MARRETIIDLREVGLSRRAFHELRAEARKLGVEPGALVQVMIGEWVREKRRRRKV